NERSRKMFRSWLMIAFVLVAFPSLAAEFSLTSPTLKDNGKIGNEQVYSGFGCTGGNISPELQWQNAPKDTKSFALTVYDPDAQTGSGWWHWLIFNIPPSVNKLPAKAGNKDSGQAP